MVSFYFKIPNLILKCFDNFLKLCILIIKINIYNKSKSFGVRSVFNRIVRNWSIMLGLIFILYDLLVFIFKEVTQWLKSILVMYIYITTNISNGKHLSDATKKKLTEQKTGRKWINNGIELKFVKQEDIDKFLLDGWVLGRFEMPKEQKEKISKSGKNLCLINNGKENKRVKLADVDFYLKQGWLLGFTEDFGKKVSNFKKGKSQSVEQIKRRTSTFKGRVWMNNGIDNRWVKPEEVRVYISNGFTKGKILNVYK